MSTWIIGALIVIVSLAGAALPSLRYLNTVLAVGLFFSAWLLPTVHHGTIWNNVLVALALFVLSLAGIESDGLIRDTAERFRAEP